MASRHLARGVFVVALITGATAVGCGGDSGVNFTSGDGGPDGSAGASGGAAGSGTGGSGGSGGTAGAAASGGSGGSGGGTAGSGGSGGSAGGAAGGSGTAGAAGSAGADGGGAVCGNSTVESGEDCDDGAQNGVSGSGCDASCKFECQNDNDCTDNNACNGAETCAQISGGQTCQTGTAVASVSCYRGSPSELTVTKTACKAGTQYCVNGTAGQCIGEVLPTPESCNSIDDNCDGSIDEGLGNITCGVGACQKTVAACNNGAPNTCTPNTGSANETCGDSIDNNCNGLIDEGCGCVAVAPSGDDTTGNGTAGTPYKTIVKGIAAAGTNGLPMQVCVASNAGCGSGSPSNANYDENVVMRDGVAVYGGYQPSGSTWPRMAGCQTTIRAQAANGVSFPVTVTNPTILDGFTINAHNDATNAAITVTGSIGAVISNNAVNGADQQNSVGILVQDSSGTAAKPTIRSNAITGGTGSASAIGIRSVNSAPVITRNCDQFDSAGRCTRWGCFNASLFVRGRAANNIGSATAETYAVKLESSPNTVVDTSAICSSDGQGDVAGLRIAGNGAGVVVRQNQIVATGGNTGNVNGVGVWMDACNGAAPWIVDNSLISGQSRTPGGRADGVRAVGDCNPRIDSNVLIVGGEESAQNDAIGVYCALDVGTNKASRCTILDNVRIQGSGGGFPPTTAGVRCDKGACARLERNIITGQSGINTFGVILNGAATFVDSNTIDAGCTTGTGIGLQSVDSSARVQNNVIRGGGHCTNASPTSTFGVQVLLTNSGNELDLHSNDVFGIGVTAGCTSRGLALDVAPGGASAPTAGTGVYRNNNIDAGQCPTAYSVLETVASTDPRVFENNDVWPAAPTALYRDEGTTNITTFGGINALADMTAAGVISSDPLFVSVGTADYHLTSGSPCRNAGTNANAPGADWETDTRPQENTCDIGADEFVP